MDKYDYLIIIIFFFIIFSIILLELKIKEFMFTLKTCEDDFKIIEKCHCVPCSWHNAEKYNVKNECKK